MTKTETEFWPWRMLPWGPSGELIRCGAGGGEQRGRSGEHIRTERGSSRSSPLCLGSHPVLRARWSPRGWPLVTVPALPPVLWKIGRGLWSLLCPA